MEKMSFETAALHCGSVQTAESIWGSRQYEQTTAKAERSITKKYYTENRRYYYHLAAL